MCGVDGVALLQFRAALDNNFGAIKSHIKTKSMNRRIIAALRGPTGKEGEREGGTMPTHKKANCKNHTCEIAPSLRLVMVEKGNVKSVSTARRSQLARRSDCTTQLGIVNVFSLSLSPHQHYSKRPFPKPPPSLFGPGICGGSSGGGGVVELVVGLLEPTSSASHTHTQP